MDEPYREDLAFVHDAGFGWLAEAAAEALLDELGRAGVTRGLVVDLGCGSGILSERVARAGFDVLGIDLSPALIALARRRVPDGSFRVESLLSAELPPCVAIAAVGECFNYLFDDRHSEEAVREVFRRAYDSLQPGGLLVTDVAGPGRGPGSGVHKSYMEGPGWAVLVAVEEDPGQGVLTRRITTFREFAAGAYRRDQETHRLRLLARPEVESWLCEAGFRVRVVDGYGPVRLPAGLVGYWAHKPEPERTGSADRAASYSGPDRVFL
jgi:SAM-dependent methyltransferase